MTKKIRITKMFTFEMAHALLNYDGSCKNLHGHSYKLYVTVIGEPLDDQEDPKHGMVMDFSNLKHIVKNEIVEVFDHCLLLNRKQPLEDLDDKFNILYVDYQPTSENILIDFADRIQKHLPHKAKLYSLKLHETETSYAEWFSSDQT